MPPKKEKRVTLSNQSRLRRVFSRAVAKKRAPEKHRTVLVFSALSEYEDCEQEFGLENALCASRSEKPKFRAQKIKKKATAKVFPKSPNISDVEVSDDEEGAGQFEEPEANNTDELKMRKLQEQWDSLDNVSLEVFDRAGNRLKTDQNNRITGFHENQPSEAWKPPCYEELVGNHMPIRPKKKPKKNVLESVKMQEDSKKSEKKQNRDVPQLQPVPEETAYRTLCRTIREDHDRRVDDAKKRAEQSIVVFFNTITKTPGNKVARLTNDRLSGFSYTPIRGNRIGPSRHSNRISEAFEEIQESEFVSKLKNASTPIDRAQGSETFARQSKNQHVSVPVFDLSDKSDSEEKEILDDCQKTIEEHDRKDSEALKTLEMGETNENLDPEKHQEDIMVPECSLRKAETSMTQMLQDTEDEHSEPDEESKYSKKRQRTKSPETMALTENTEQAIEEPVQDSKTPARPEEHETALPKRAALQPQERQLLRESRLSVMTTASSRRESINSLMEDMSLDMQLIDDTLGDMLMKTQGSTRVESRACTGMTIRHEDTIGLPFYLADGSFEEAPSCLKQLLHVVGQTETKRWTELPKSALLVKNVKKLGEGSYGEVFSTVWNGAAVAIKVVPFESEQGNRVYQGEHHMQFAAEILPEVIVMRELSRLRNTDTDESTPNFINMISAEIVTGEYPKSFLKAWDAYDKAKESLNIRPDDYASKTQNFIIFVAENGGVALEDFVLQSEHELRSILIQLLLSMQVAETSLEFEHRDLHLGNVLIDRSGVEKLMYKKNGTDIWLTAHGVKVNIIDFTLSRIRKEGTTVYSDLEQDEMLFEGQGHPQFDVYRKMRAHNKGKWMEFEQKTNLMWIEFIANQLVDSEICPPGLLTEKRKTELRSMFEQLGKYECCLDSFMDEKFYDRFFKGYLDIGQPV